MAGRKGPMLPTDLGCNLANLGILELTVMAIMVVVKPEHLQAMELPVAVVQVQQLQIIKMVEWVKITIIGRVQI